MATSSEEIRSGQRPTTRRQRVVRWARNAYTHAFTSTRFRRWASAVTVAFLAVASWRGLLGVGSTGASLDVVRLEFAGSAQRMLDLYASAHLTGGGRMVDATRWDFVLIALYTVTISAWCRRAGRPEVFRSALSRRWARAAASAVFLAAALDVAENIFLLRADSLLTHANQAAPDAIRDRLDWYARGALACTIPKWLILAVAIPIMLLAMATATRDGLLHLQLLGTPTAQTRAMVRGPDTQLGMTAFDRGGFWTKVGRTILGIIRRLGSLPTRFLAALGRFGRDPLKVLRDLGRDDPAPVPVTPPVFADEVPTEPDWKARAKAMPGGARYGICFSGGGIRSASFGLGALQVLMDNPIAGTNDNRPALQMADYIASVSGGGYLAGAHQLLARQFADGIAARGADPGLPRVDPTAEGNRPLARCGPEEDFIRRHGRYIANSPGQWIVGLSRVLVGLVMNLTVFALVLFVFGRPIGWWLYNLIYDEPRADAIHHIPTGIWLSIGACAAIGFLATFVAIVLSPDADATDGSSLGGFLWRLAGLLGLLGALIFVTTIGVPLVVIGVHQVVTWVGGLLPHTSNDTAAGAATATTVVAGTTAASAALSFRSQSAAKAQKQSDKSGTIGQVAASMPKYGKIASKYAPKLAGLGLVVLALIVVSVFAYAVPEGGPLGAFGGSWREGTVWLIAVAVLTLIYFVVDQTSWSLHPLYKRRLSSAFAIRPTNGSTCGGPERRQAKGFPFAESTAMTHYLRPVPGLPSLVICAVANVSGQDVAPPGRRAVTFTFEHDLIGGPQVCWTTPALLEEALGPNKQDATLMAAVAMSGAAFASAMGRESHGALNAVLTVLNLRLGVWLPSPEYVRELMANQGPLVRRRHLSYLFKELFDLYSLDDRFLYVSDGGHLENLGLVELLRRRCGNVFCFDASGDSPTFPTTLSQAIELAEEQLPVRITFEDGELEKLLPGSVTDAKYDNDPLKARYGSRSVAIGTIRYTDTQTEGKLIFARATMTPGSDPFIRSHAHRSPRFPNDSTGDQFFDEERFDAYLRLGREVAEAALDTFP